MPGRLVTAVIRDIAVLRSDQDVRSAVEEVLAAGLPALPVVDESGEPCGIFGEREFLEAVFPAYLRTLKSAAFVPKQVDQQIEKRAEAASETVGEHMNTEHIAVESPPGDVQLAELFLHHRVLIIPITEGGKVIGVVTRSDFFRALAQRFLAYTRR